MSIEIFAPALPSIPWQERPAGSRETVWRYSGNPVIGRDATPTSNSVFNSAVVPFRDGFAGVFRADDRRRYMQLHTGFSKDGIDWELTPEPIRFLPECPSAGSFTQGYDPRVLWLEDRWYVIWCNWRERADHRARVHL